jgi:hypothetical protein
MVSDQSRNSIDIRLSSPAPDLRLFTPLPDGVILEGCAVEDIAEALASDQSPQSADFILRGLAGYSEDGRNLTNSVHDFLYSCVSNSSRGETEEARKLSGDKNTAGRRSVTWDGERLT